MASGDLLASFSALAYEPPSSGYPQIVVRNNHPLLAFDDTTQETSNWSGIMPPNYGGGNLVVKIMWMGRAATSGNVVWDATFEDLAAQDQDSDGYATSQQAAATAASATSGILSTTSITCTAGSAGTDSLAAGDPFRVRVRRVAADAGDTMVGDAQLQLVNVYEA